MKKIRTLIVALLCLTIGGVYATWTFADDANVDRKGETVTITLAEKVESSEVLGSLSIVFSDDFNITIDQKTQANPAQGITADHTAVLQITGSITLKFKANASADADVRANGIKAHYYFAASDIKYNDDSDTENAEKPIYNIDTATKYVIEPANTTGDVEKWTFDSTNKEFTYTLNAEALAELIKINTFVIDNSAEYATFNQILRSGTITLYLNDTATPNA